MKTKLFVFLAFFISSYLFQTQVVSAQVTQETRRTSSFTKVRLNIAAKVFLKQGDKLSVILKGEKDELAKVKTIVSGGKLTIKKKNNFSLFGKQKPIKIFITMPLIEALSLSGSGDIVAAKTIKVQEIALAVSGSGDIELKDVKATKIAIKISGSGDVLLAGTETVEEIAASIAGSGDVVSHNLEAYDVLVNISGSGTCKVNALQNLKANIAGSGDVFFRGSPTVNAHVSGSGNVKPME